MTSSKDTSTKLLFIVAGFGVLLTIVTELSHHLPWLMELCGGASSGCSDVASTSFSKILGVSVAYWGLLSYVAFIMALIYAPALVFPIAAGLMGAELYFLWIMATILNIYCTFCIIQFVTVLILFLLTLIWARKRDDFLLPGKLWSAPLVIVLSFAVLAVPVKLKAKSAPLDSAALVTYQGNVSAKMKVEIFSDYECGHCKKFEPQVDKIIKNNPDVLIVFRDFIISSHKLSPVASSYANAVAFNQGPEAFVKTRTELFEHQETLRKYLQEHLPGVTFTEELKAKINAKIAGDLERATTLGVSSTPTMAIYRGDELVQVVKGFAPYERFSRFLEN